MDEVLHDAMAPVLRDLNTTGVDAPRIEDKDWTGDPDIVSTMVWSPDGSALGVQVRRSAPECERIATIADQMQEWAIEEQWAHGSSNWPPCPLHPDRHPLTATTRDEEAVWVCPTDASVIAPIGGLDGP